MTEIKRIITRQFKQVVKLSQDLKIVMVYVIDYKYTYRK